VPKLSTLPNPSTAFDLLDPFEVIETMIDLRIQLTQLEQQIQTLQPSFFAACLILNQAKIERDRAIISRKLTPAQWTYAIDILEQEQDRRLEKGGGDDRTDLSSLVANPSDGWEPPHNTQDKVESLSSVAIAPPVTYSLPQPHSILERLKF